jgi:hypothetical protein
MLLLWAKEYQLDKWYLCLSLSQKKLAMTSIVYLGNFIKDIK